MSPSSSPPKKTTPTTTSKKKKKTPAAAAAAAAEDEFLTFQVNGELVQLKRGKEVHKHWSNDPRAVQRRLRQQKNRAGQQEQHQQPLTVQEKRTAAQTLVDTCIEKNTADDDEFADELSEKLQYERQCWQEEQTAIQQKLEAAQKQVSQLQFQLATAEQEKKEAQAKLRRSVVAAARPKDDTSSSSEESEEEEENQHHNNHTNYYAAADLRAQHAWAGLPPYQPHPQQYHHPPQQRQQHQPSPPRASSSTTRLTFDESLQKLQEYKAVYGDCMVQRSYRDPATGYQLGLFVKNMRAAYKQYTNSTDDSNNKKLTRTMTPDMMDRLNALGFCWDASTPYRTWDERLQDLRDYRAEYGHVQVPSTYKGRFGLAHFVARLRMKRLGKKSGKGPLTAQQIQELDALGFVWVLRKRKEHFLMAATKATNEDDDDDDAAVAEPPLTRARI